MSDNGNTYSLININLDGLGQACSALIKKISKAVGWVATHDTPSRIAVQQYIDAIQNSDLDPLIKAAKISRAKRDIKEYCNQAKIISDAIPQINSTSDPSKIDDDWLSMFMDKARLVNSESLQAIWSRILAQECNENNSISKRLLSILSFISVEQANAFKTVCQFLIRFVVDNEEYTSMPIITSFEGDGSDIYSRAGLNYFKLQELDSLGLLRYSATHHAASFARFPSTPMIAIGDKQYKIVNPSNSTTLCIGHVLLTNDGDSLCSIVEHKLPEGFLEECERFWKETDNISILEVCADQAEAIKSDTANQN